MDLPTLTYFSSRGRAELIRLVCAEAGVAYREKGLGVYHPVDKTPDFNALKATGILPFDMVPIWEEPGGFLLAESDAIVRHLARTHGLYGRDAREAARCDMIFSALDGMRTDLRRLVSVAPAERAAQRDELRERILPRWLGYFERILSANGGDFIVGGAVTFVDVTLLLAFENLRDNGFGAAYAACPKLTAHGERMAARPGLARYVASAERFPVQLLPA
jgi:glutathione S-transferase